MGWQGTASAWRELEQGGNKGEELVCFAGLLLDKEHHGKEIR